MVIPAPITYVKVVAVKKFLVVFVSRSAAVRQFIVSGVNWPAAWPPAGGLDPKGLSARPNSTTVLFTECHGGPSWMSRWAGTFTQKKLEIIVEMISKSGKINFFLILFLLVIHNFKILPVFATYLAEQLPHRSLFITLFWTIRSLSLELVRNFPSVCKCFKWNFNWVMERFYDFGNLIWDTGFKKGIATNLFSVSNVCQLLIPVEYVGSMHSKKFVNNFMVYITKFKFHIQEFKCHFQNYILLIFEKKSFCKHKFTMNFYSVFFWIRSHKL